MANIIFVALLLAIPGFSADLWPFGGGGSGNATKIRGVTVKASLGCTDGQVLTYVSANTQFECTDVSVAGGSGDITAVTAGTGLTGGGTSGAVTVSIAADLERTAAGRWKFYDSTGPTTVTIQAGSAQSSNNLLEMKSAAGSTQAFVTATGYFNFAGGYIGTPGKIDLGYYAGRLGLSSDYALTFSSTTSVTGSPDLGLARSSANNLAVTNGSSTTYWTLGAAGITCASGDGNSAACDVGTTGARVRNVLATGTVTGATLISGPEFRTTGSNWKLTDSSGSSFGLMQFGGTTSSFPALKRSTTSLEAKLADDSAYTSMTMSEVHLGGAAGTDGTWRLTVSGGSLLIQKRESGSYVTKSTIAP